MSVENTAATAAPVNVTPVSSSETPTSPPAAVSPAPAASAPEATPPPAQPSATPAPEAVGGDKGAEKKEVSLLGAEPKTAPVEPPKTDTPTEIKADANAPLEGSQSADPAPLPTYEAFKLPEGINFENERLAEFTKELGEFQTLTKADQAAVQAFGQKLVDRHIAEVNTVLQRMNEAYANAWERKKVEWKDAFVADPEIGGNRQETTLNAALQFIRTHGGTEAQQAEFRALMNDTGIGNHPAMIRLLATASSAMSEGRPLAASKPVPQTNSKVAKRYGST